MDVVALAGPGAAPPLGNGALAVAATLSGVDQPTLTLTLGGGGEPWVVSISVPGLAGLELTSGQVDLSTGTLTATYSSGACAVTTTVRPLRQLPGTAHVRVVASGAELPETLEYVHELVSGSVGATTTFSGEALADAHAVAGAATDTFVLRGSTPTSEVACAYSTLGVTCAKSYNLASTAGAGAYARLRTPSRTLDLLISLSLPPFRGQTTRALLALVPRSVADVVAAHEARWAAAWSTRLDVVPRAPEAASTLKCRTLLKRALYRLHSADPTSLVAVSPLGAAVVLPALVLVAPDAAARLLDASSSRELLEAGAARAAELGLRGALLSPAPIGSRTIAADDPAGPGVLLTCAAAAGAWALFLAQNDAQRLRERSYPALRAAAELVTSLAEPAEGFPGSYTLRAGAGLSPARAATERDHALTVAAARLALRGAIEASYELSLEPRPLWSELLAGLALPLEEVEGHVRVAFSRVDTTPPAQRELAEPLLALMPWYGGPEGALPPPSTAAARRALLEASAARWAPPAVVTSTRNALLRVLALAQLAQYGGPAATDSFLPEVESLMAGLLEADAEYLMHAGDDELVDSSLVVLAVAQGLGSLNLTGGVAAGRYRYAPLGVAAAPAACLPLTWERLLLRGVGGDSVDFAVQNRLPTSAPSEGWDPAPWSAGSITL